MEINEAHKITPYAGLHLDTVAVWPGGGGGGGGGAGGRLPPPAALKTGAPKYS